MKHSLDSNDKLRLKSEFDYVREYGKKYVSGICLLVAAPARDGKLRCGVICGKKYSNKAVLRNRARRIIWESFRLLKQRISPAHILFITRKGIAGKKQPEVETFILRLLKQAGLMED
ncbi:MAG: ribonuclease P protein component [Lentisphaerae bacterium GWF2_44_16]|nr:MAG: ribonuclease P protein component [Lentisphaerae bacterium GWF2_44_16]